MAIFSIQKGKVKKIPPNKVGLERDIQKIFEDNLNEILNITFLASEYSTSFGGRIDSLGIDNNGSPCIIEYKRGQNDNVINQGLSYLRWLLDHKADFEVLVQKAKVNLDIDWASPRVICVAESYNKFDLDTADLLPINIELFRYRIYQSNILLVEAETQQRIRISTSKIIKRSKKQKAQNELQRSYSVEDHLKKADQKVKRLFLRLRELITSLDESIIEEPKAKYIAYKLTTNFTDIEIRNRKLKVYLNLKSGQLRDPEGIAQDLTKPKPVGHWGNGDYRVIVEREEDIDKVFELIKQSYSYNK